MYIRLKLLITCIRVTLDPLVHKIPNGDFKNLAGISKARQICQGYVLLL